MEKIQLEQMQLQPSRLLAAILIIAHVTALCLLLTLPLDAGLLAGATLLLVFSADFSISRHALLRHARSVVRLELTDREHLRWQTRAGSWQSGRILGSSTVAPWLTVLNVRCDGRRWPLHVVLLTDSLDAAAFRRLRVWLRWGPRTEAGDATAT